MVSVTCFNRRFTPDWRMAILALLVFALFIHLGFWQLDRAAEKKRMVATHLKLAEQTPLSWTPGMINPKQYQPLVVEGRFLPDLFLLDNQHYQHQFGYDVLSPVLVNPGTVVLVDRGWIAAETRQTFPSLTIPANFRHLTGYAYYPSQKNWLLGEAYEKKKGNIIVIEQIDTKIIGQFLHKSVYPFIIRLGKKEEGGYIREWAIVAMPPERHYAYAVQWFAMASVILILFIVLNLKKNYENFEA